MRYIKIISLSIILVISPFIVPITKGGESQNLHTTKIWVKKSNNCEHGVHLQPNGPIGVILFCEDAVGEYIGIVYYQRMEAPAPLHFLRKLSEHEKTDFYKTWSLDNRMWQEPVWASDVTGFAWGPEGIRLYVSTSDIYGSGALYELDMVRKNYKQIAPRERTVTLKNPGPGFKITKIDNKKRNLYYEVAPWYQNKKTPKKDHTYTIE